MHNFGLIQTFAKQVPLPRHIMVITKSPLHAPFIRV